MSATRGGVAVEAGPVCSICTRPVDSVVEDFVVYADGHVTHTECDNNMNAWVNEDVANWFRSLAGGGGGGGGDDEGAPLPAAARDLYDLNERLPGGAALSDPRTAESDALGAYSFAITKPEHVPVRVTRAELPTDTFFVPFAEGYLDPTRAASVAILEARERLEEALRDPRDRRAVVRAHSDDGGRTLRFLVTWPADATRGCAPDEVALDDLARPAEVSATAAELAATTSRIARAVAGPGQGRVTYDGTVSSVQVHSPTYYESVYAVCVRSLPAPCERELAARRQCYCADSGRVLVLPPGSRATVLGQSREDADLRQPSLSVDLLDATMQCPLEDAGLSREAPGEEDRFIW